MGGGTRFKDAYQELERRMKVLAEADGDLYVPNPEPLGPVDYFLIAMEPSLGHWARSAAEAKVKDELAELKEGRHRFP